jgi:hypothetical protein
MAGLGATGRPAVRPRCTALDGVAPAASAHRYDAYGRCARRSPWCMGFCPSVPHPGMQCLGAGVACGLGRGTGHRHGPGPAAPGRSGAWGVARAVRIPGCSAWGQALDADLDSALDIGTDLGRRRRGVQVHGVLPATMRADVNWSRHRRSILTVHGVLPAPSRIGATWSSRCLASWRIAMFRRGATSRRDGLLRTGFATLHGVSQAVGRQPWAVTEISNSKEVRGATAESGAHGSPGCGGWSVPGRP